VAALDLQLDFKRRYRLAHEVLETIALTLIMFLVVHISVQDFTVDGMSMEPNLHDQEFMLVDKWSYLFHDPARGDIVVFVAPPNPSQDYVKRIIGLPGDVITVQGTQVIVNGKRLNEAYLDPRRQGNPYPSFTNRVVPPDSYFVLGDNRAGSSDSRDWGCVPRTNIIGRAVLIYWPPGLNNSGFLPDVTSVYQHIPPPPINHHNSMTHCPIALPNLP
jgi:signal peptidase I